MSSSNDAHAAAPLNGRRQSLRILPVVIAGITSVLFALLLLLTTAQSSSASESTTASQFPLNATPTPVTNFYLLTQPPDPRQVISSTGGSEGLTPQQIYVVQPWDTLLKISLETGISIDSIAKINNLEDINRLEIGQVLIIPNPDGTAPPLPASVPGIQPSVPISIVEYITRTEIVSRMTALAQSAGVTSPYYKTTWVAFYGRPNTPVMGIVGEEPIDRLTDILKDRARQIDALNGPGLRTRAAFHLVHGMATIAEGENGSHLAYLPDETVMAYIQQGLRYQVAVILDVQMGSLSVTEALSPVMKYLRYPNVHLALDPEFAMTQPGQETPGNPIGYITGSQINEAQEYIENYLTENNIRGRRILIVHQFFDSMIPNKDVIDWSNPKVELTIVADGFGPPGPKIVKYNDFFPADTPVSFTGLKLFNRWDEPLITDAQALGEERYTQRTFIDVTPNILIWQ